MLASDLIKELQKIIDEDGDLPVFVSDERYGETEIEEMDIMILPESTNHQAYHKVPKRIIID